MQDQIHRFHSAIAKRCLEQVATGGVISRALLIEVAFRLVGLDLRGYVVSDRGLCRLTDIAVIRGNPAKKREWFGWVAKHKIADIVRLMISLVRGASALRNRHQYRLAMS